MSVERQEEENFVGVFEERGIADSPAVPDLKLCGDLKATKLKKFLQNFLAGNKIYLQTLF